MYHNIISKILKPDKDAPEWVLIFEKGWREIEGEGKVLIDKKAFDIAAATIKRRGIDIVFDYEHQTLLNVEAPASGFNKEWRWNPDQGIEARVDWTEKANGYITRKEYKYISPVFQFRKSDRRLVSIHSVALTNSPKTNQLKPIIAKLNNNIDKETIMPFKKIAKSLGIPEETDEAGIITAMSKLQEPMTTISAKLELPKDASLDDIEQAIYALRKEPIKKVIAKEICEALGLETNADSSTVVASINTLKAGTAALDPVTKDLNALREELKEIKAKTLIDEAQAKGQTTPAELEDWGATMARDTPEIFKQVVCSRPMGDRVPVTPLDGKTPEIKTDVPKEHIDIAAKMGLSKEDIEKYGGE